MVPFTEQSHLSELPKLINGLPHNSTAILPSPKRTSKLLHAEKKLNTIVQLIICVEIS